MRNADHKCHRCGGWLNQDRSCDRCSAAQRLFGVVKNRAILKCQEITIQHPLGLFMQFPANHKKAVELVQFGAECIRALENDHAREDYSI